MKAHVLSKVPKELRYYKNFIVMTRQFGYSKQTILELKRMYMNAGRTTPKKQMKTMEQVKKHIQPMRKEMECRN